MGGLSGNVGYTLQLAFGDHVSSHFLIWTTQQSSVSKMTVIDEDAKAAEAQSLVQGHPAHWDQSQGLASDSQIPDHLTFPCSIKTKHLKVVLGDQDLKKTEFHEQRFGVEKIFKYKHYNESEEIPHNDIGKCPLWWISHGSCPG